ncbi:hypothetical protein L6452_06150 [Arctium lappa]|uniref:Uncharacterized protein n=1 Tax=Arctium lappa TaxID=4217 RepID=A0ACB9EJ24_ARCLA|nr:hypothetical protein L6452_06150 [Arctium lappa]
MPTNYFTAQVDHFETKLTLNKLRRVLDLPRADSFLGRQDFKDVASKEELCADIISLGYGDALEKALNFKATLADTAAIKDTDLDDTRSEASNDLFDDDPEVVFFASSETDTVVNLQDTSDDDDHD